MVPKYVVYILSMTMVSKSIQFQEEFKKQKRSIVPRLEYPLVMNNLENSCNADFLHQNLWTGLHVFVKFISERTDSFDCS